MNKHFRPAFSIDQRIKQFRAFSLSLFSKDAWIGMRKQSDNERLFHLCCFRLFVVENAWEESQSMNGRIRIRSSQWK